MRVSISRLQMMKRLTAILCVCALACNTALASVGGMVYCVDKEIDEHQHLTSMSVAGGEESCCSSELSHSPKEHRYLMDCDLCIDIIIEPADLENAKPSVDRVAAKTLPLFECGFQNLAAKTGEQRPELKQLPARIPLVPLGAITQYAATIQFRC